MRVPFSFLLSLLVLVVVYVAAAAETVNVSQSLRRVLNEADTTILSPVITDTPATTTVNEPATENLPSAETVGSSSSSSSSSSFAWQPLDSSSSFHDENLRLSAKDTATTTTSSNATIAHSGDNAASTAHARSIQFGPIVLGAVGVACVGAAVFATKKRTTV